MGRGISGLRDLSCPPLADTQELFSSGLAAPLARPPGSLLGGDQFRGRPPGRVFFLISDAVFSHRPRTVHARGGSAVTEYFRGHVCVAPSWWRAHVSV